MKRCLIVSLSLMLAVHVYAVVPGGVGANGNAGVLPEIAGAARAGAALQRGGPPPGVRMSVTAGWAGTRRTDLREAEGSVASERDQYGASLSVPLRGMNRLNASVDYERSRYNLRLPDNSTVANALEDGRVTRVGVSGLQVLDAKTSYFYGADVSAGMEEGADVGTAVTWGGMVSRRYQYTTNFAFSIGFIAHTRLEEYPLLLPIPGIEWQINRHWSLRTAQGMTLSWDAQGNRKWVVDFTTGYESRNYRLAAGDELSGGVLTDRRVPLTVALRYKPHPAMQLRVFTGTTVWQDLVFRDADGAKVESLKTGYALVGGLSAGLNF